MNALVSMAMAMRRMVAHAAPNPRGVGRAAWLLAALACVVLPGCDESSEVETAYGRRHGFGYEKSINGTAVLADMLESRGHRVVSRTSLSPGLNNTDVIIWFPDSLALPSREVQQWLEDWLRRGYNRTLVYVGRDYDAQADYWRAILPMAPRGQQDGIRKRLALAERSFAALRSANITNELPKDSEVNVEQGAKSPRKTPPKTWPADGPFNEYIEDDDAPWFTYAVTESSTPAPRAPVETAVKNKGKGAASGIAPAFGPLTKYAVETFTGPWSDGVDAKRARAVVYDRVLDYEADEELLAAEAPCNAVLIGTIKRESFGLGQMIVVQNGSLLLNLPLINHEHRRVAGHLIHRLEARGGSKADITFLVSDDDGVPIRERDSGVQPPTAADYPPPLSDILYHGIVLAIVVAFASWPIFGRPRSAPPPPLSDFGQHVESVGALLAQSRDDHYCQQCVDQFLIRDAPAARRGS